MKQKHYSTEQQIIDRIDALKSEAETLNKYAEFLSEQHLTMSKEHSAKFPDSDWGDLSDEDRSYYMHAIQIKQEAAAVRKRAKRIEEIRLPKLGDLLSEFRTVPMIPILGNDNSVAI